MMIKLMYLATVSLAAMIANPSAAAQPAPPEQPAAAATNSRTTVYQAAYFTQFAPRTALDIAKRVPGFTLDLGATQTNQGQVDVRGFAGTAGNVVFNGARPIPRRKLSTSLSPESPLGVFASKLVRATCSVPIMQARARC